MGYLPTLAKHHDQLTPTLILRTYENRDRFKSIPGHNVVILLLKRPR